MIRLWASAKLTLSLRVVGTRPDGLHFIDAEMVTLDLADRIDIGPGNGLEVDVGGVRVDQGATGGDDLVSRALALAGRTADVRVTKAIPTGAGLGGGSADAAAVLRWAGYDDLEGAAGIGADVAFCLVGGRARVAGIGEQVRRLPFEPTTVTLLTPPFGCATAAVYSAWDHLEAGTGRVARPMGSNDLEPAALEAYPDLARWRDELGDATGAEPHLAGSGSTWFVHGSFPGADRVVAHTTPAGWAGPGE